jgi:heme iron utilization protein
MMTAMSDNGVSPAPPPADNRRAIRTVMRACRKAALGTSLEGRPYVSLVTVALDHDLSPILLLSRLAEHTRNLLDDRRASLLFDGSEGHANPQTGPRVTIVGTAAESAEPRLQARFLARHPAAALYAGFGDFAIWRLEIERAHFVGGFARAVWFEPPLGLPEGAAAAMAAAEPAILSHMNADHVDAIGRMAAHHLGRAPGRDPMAGWGAEGWRMAGIDPDGCDLVLGDDHFARLPFDRPLDGAPAARAALAALAGAGKT